MLLEIRFLEGDRDLNNHYYAAHGIIVVMPLPGLCRVADCDCPITRDFWFFLCHKSA